MYHKNSLYYICILIAFLIIASIANAQSPDVTKINPVDVYITNYSDTLSNVKRLSEQNERLSRELYNLRKELYISDFMKQKYTDLYWAVMDMLKCILDEPIGKSQKYTIAFKKYQSLLNQLK